jgi:hypothetical protein
MLRLTYSRNKSIPYIGGNFKAYGVKIENTFKSVEMRLFY